MIFRSFAKIISISLFSVVLLSNLAFANLESAQELIENQSLGLSQESEEIKNLLHSTLMDNRYELNGHMLESIKHLNIDTKNAFKVYYTEKINKFSIKTYKEFNGIKKLIDKKEYTWAVPVLNKKDELTHVIFLEKGKLLEEIKKDKKIGLNEELENIIKKREGKWFVSGIVSSRPDDMQDMYNIILNKLSNGYIANQMSKKEAIDYELLSLGGTGIIIAYFNDANGNEYGITFTDREDLTGVTNGKLYTLDEIFNIIESNISIMSPVNNEVDLFDLEIFGGSANKEKSSQFPLENPSLLILSGDLIITAMTILLIKKRVAKIKS